MAKFTRTNKVVFYDKVGFQTTVTHENMTFKVSRRNVTQDMFIRTLIGYDNYASIERIYDRYEMSAEDFKRLAKCTNKNIKC